MGARSTSFLVTVSWMSVLTATPSLAADLMLARPMQDTLPPMTGGLPAVSGINGKVMLYGGSEDGDGTFTAEGSLSIPVLYSYGLQLDGSIGTRDGDTSGHIGGHLFWRDPAVGLLGIYAAYHSIGGDHFQRYAVEGHYYSGSWTFEGFAGWDDGEQDDAFFGLAEIAKYVHDDFRVSAGLSYSNWESGSYEGPGLLGTAAFEWQTNWLGPNHAQTIFAEGKFGDDYTKVVGGVKLYLGGEPKSLIRRHREDDPPAVADDKKKKAGSAPSDTE